MSRFAELRFENPQGRDSITVRTQEDGDLHSYWQRTDLVVCTVCGAIVSDLYLTDHELRCP